MLTAFGSEHSVSKCGVEQLDNSNSDVLYSSDVYPVDSVLDDDSEEELSEVLLGSPAPASVKGALALVLAAQEGLTQALVPLTTLLSTGVGLSPLLNDLEGQGGRRGRHILANVLKHVPLPLTAASPLSFSPSEHSGLSVAQLEGVVVGREEPLVLPLPLVFRLSRILRESAGLAVDSPGCRASLASRRGHELSPAGGLDIPLSDSVFGWNSPSRHSKVITQLASGLLLLAALDDHADAVNALQKRCCRKLSSTHDTER